MPGRKTVRKRPKRLKRKKPVVEPIKEDDSEMMCLTCMDETKATLLKFGCTCSVRMCLKCYIDWDSESYKFLRYPFDNPRAMRTIRKTRCPGCRHDIVNPVLEFKNVVDCPICDEKNVDQEHLLGHLSWIRCTYCSKYVSKSDFPNHIRDDCEKIECLHCKRIGTFDQLLTHSSRVNPDVGITAQICTIPGTSILRLSPVFESLFNKLSGHPEYPKYVQRLFTDTVQWNKDDTVDGTELATLMKKTDLFPTTIGSMVKTLTKLYKGTGSFTDHSAFVLHLVLMTVGWKKDLVPNVRMVALYLLTLFMMGAGLDISTPLYNELDKTACKYVITNIIGRICEKNHFVSRAFAPELMKHLFIVWQDHDFMYGPVAKFSKNEKAIAKKLFELISNDNRRSRHPFLAHAFPLQAFQSLLGPNVNIMSIVPGGP